MAPYYMVPVAMGANEMAQGATIESSSRDALILTTEWYFELGDEPERDFQYGDTEIIDALIRDEGVEEAREKFVDNGRRDMVGDDYHRYDFGLWNMIRELGDVLKNDDWSTSFLGGYEVEIANVSETDAYNVVEFNVTNITGWASATRVWGFSFKANEERSESGPGGNLKQVYRWRERIAK